jgi:hypothetical protein
VLTTPAINPCHGFSVIASVVETVDKFITGVIDTSKNFAPFHAVPMKLLATGDIAVMV